MRFADPLEVADGGAPEVFHGSPLLGYFVGGPFFVQVTTKPDSTVNVQASSAPLHASVQITSTNVAAGATSSASALLLPQDGGTYMGIASLAWPLGGDLDVSVAVAGQVTTASAMMDVPQLEVVPGSASAVGIQQAVPFCVRSSSLNGSVAVHLDHATFTGGSSTDSMGVLAPGDCDSSSFVVGATGADCNTEVVDAAASDGGASWVRSHVQLSGTPPSDVTASDAAVGHGFAITATLQNAPASVTTTSAACVNPAPPPVVVHLSSDAPGGHALPKTQVKILVEASYIAALADADGGVAGDIDGSVPMPAAGVAISFQIASSVSAQVQVVPGSVAIVPSIVTIGSDGKATATLAMPNLGPTDGVLVIEALGGAQPSLPLVLTNN